MNQKRFEIQTKVVGAFSVIVKSSLTFVGMWKLY